MWLYGYTFPGFATIQKAVDDYILNLTSSSPITTQVGPPDESSTYAPFRGAL